MDGAGGDRRGRARAGDHAVAPHAAALAAGGLVRGQGHRRAAQRVRWPRGEGLVTAPTPDQPSEAKEPHGVTMHMSPRHAMFGTKIPPMSQAEHCTMVIFGATGDLTKRKLFPALYQLAAEHLLAPGFAVLAVGREASLTDETFRTRMREALGESDEVKRVDEEVWKAFEKRIFFVGGDATDAAAYE